MDTVVSTMRMGLPKSYPVLTSAAGSFGKQDPHSQAWVQKFRPDPVIQPNPNGHVLHVRSSSLTQVRNLVDESDLLARNALDAYLTTSAVRRSVNRMGALFR